MSVSIKVAIRCRPFTIDDTLGVQLAQNADEEGEVTLINTAKYTTTRFPFTYAWWSAYGWQVTARILLRLALDLLKQRHTVFMGFSGT